MSNYSIGEASEEQSTALRNMIVSIVVADPANPLLASFRHSLAEDPMPGERFVEYAVVVDGELAARCQINFAPQAADIGGYGAVAAQLLENERVATLTGDLVTPGFRGLGLQSKMTEFRLQLMVGQGISYAMCGILAGNNVSRDNYLRRGFIPIGEKDIDWGEDEAGDRHTSVTLYGLRLGDH